MATIITVHGTNNTGPTDAPIQGQGYWWQRDGFFERCIRELVGPEHGELKFEPLVWNGDNSEIARWEAGRALFANASRLEAAKEPYVVLGHSHGGSIIRHFLEQAALNRKAMPGLSAWITVGTPFIESRAIPLLANRLTVWGKSAYFLSAFFVLWLLVSFLAFADFSAGVSAAGLLRVLVLFLPAAGIYMILRLLQPRKLLLSQRKRLANGLRDNFADRWVSIYHKDDEAIQGLRLLKRLSVSPLEPAFATSTILVGLFFILISLVPIVALSEPTSKEIILQGSRLLGLPGAGDMKELAAFFKSYQQPIDLDDFLHRTMILGLFFFALPVTIAQALGLGHLIPVWGQMSTGPLIASILAVFFLSLIMLWMATNIVVYILFFASSSMSHVLSRAINSLVRSGIRRSGFGSDFHGERGISANPGPPWLDSVPPPIPAELADEITRVSDEAAARSIAKFRSTVSELVALEGAANARETVAQYLTWTELIHTSYFRVPRFCKLVVYAISRSPGFGPSEAFKRDPEYPLVAGWYEEIRTLEPRSARSGTGRLVKAETPAV
jgi:hypothetical protein